MDLLLFFNVGVKNILAAYILYGGLSYWQLKIMKVLGLKLSLDRG